MSRMNKKELAAVTVVGLGLSAITGMVLPPIAVGTGLYVAGVYIGQKRPEEGWFSSPQLEEVDVFESEELGALALSNPPLGLPPAAWGVLGLVGMAVAYKTYHEQS